MDKYIKIFKPFGDSYDLVNYLGSGSFGNVWEVSVLIQNEVKSLAVKEIIVPTNAIGSMESACLQGLNPENMKVFFKDFLQRSILEAELQSKLSNCKNIVHIIDYKIFELDKLNEFGWVIYILMDKVEVFTSYLLNNGISILNVINLGIDMCSALENCKINNIVHQDIKPENIFYNNELNCFQLGDFGISHYVNRPTESKGRAGTLTHMSPEVYKGADFSYEDDLYAVGMIIYKLLNFNRIPLVCDYPDNYTPSQRDKALKERLKGGVIPLPALSRVIEKDIDKSKKLKGSVKYGIDDFSIIKQLSFVAQKAILPDKKLRFKDATEFKKALEEIRKNYERF